MDVGGHPDLFRSADVGGTDFGEAAVWREEKRQKTIMAVTSIDAGAALIASVL